MRFRYKYKINSSNFFFTKLLKNFQSKKYVSILLSNSNNSDLPKDYINFDLIAGIDKLSSLVSNNNSFNSLEAFHKKHKDWMFGYLSYDLKNENEGLSSANFDKIKSNQLEFFVPKYVFLLKGNLLEVLTYESKSQIEKLLKDLITPTDTYCSKINLKSRETKSSYIDIVKKIKNHIQIGDIYEMNYCLDFYASQVCINPELLFIKLNEITETPFAGFMHIGNNFILSASPERFLRKIKNRVLSQPIKGTIKRGRNKKEDLKYIAELESNAKEISENVMITDLVRNDLSITAKKNSVNVHELCKVYSFKKIHQMITTITSKVSNDVSFTKILESTFPMGSMTGAPKLRAMQLIEKYENFKRGIYSGSIGYIKPNGDFDFNVVIRSIIYNKKSQYLTVGVGSAITINSDPLKEYEECMVKLKPILDTLNSTIRK